MPFSDGTPVIQGATDDTPIGNVSDALKVYLTNALTIGVVDKTAFTYGSSFFQAIGGVYQDTSPALTAGQSGALRLTQNRAVHINLRNDSGTEIGTSGAPLRIDPTGTTTQPVSGTVTANQGGTWTVQPGNTANTTAWLVRPDTSLVDNAAFTDGTTRVNMAGFILDETAGTALTENDAAAARIDSKRAQIIAIEDATTRGRRAGVTVNSDFKTSDGLRNGGVHGALTLTTANTAYEAKVGGARLSNRKLLTITALDDMYWGYDNTVTTSNGTPLKKNQQIIFSIDPDSTFQIWLVASANGKTARITESP